ncbi:MAG: NUDIX hydrolase [Oscillatoriales cyanobacterium RU_3_3]|nr:NUDIX hydrolase [Microcoleus sp. SU_5_6]NJL67605.1 NUDIX hydrolase [Microcoleus sp. SM1_3_4]NJM61108.1 NUDIX hydrolase [Oscillatoriales cyanobacterium RU_3_3]NJR23536.1 NUDIX hydrolase [Richelia sp. CSU_2_1]
MNLRTALSIEQSGVIPYRIHNGEIEVMLITSSTGKRWVIPKGLIEPDMTSQDSAAKEAWEEAGLLGKVDPESIGTYEYYKSGYTCQVEVFLLKVQTVLENWPEASKRKRQWVNITKAIKRVNEPELKLIIADLPNKL